MSTTESSSSSKLTLQQRLEQSLPGYERVLHNVNAPGRSAVKEDLVRAYELQKAADTLKEMLTEERVSSNPVLKALFVEQVQEMQGESQATIETNTDLLVPFEKHLLELVKYQIVHDTRDLISIPINKKLSRWLSSQRQRVVAQIEGEGRAKFRTTAKAIQAVQEDKAILERLHVKWRLFKKRTYDDYVTELRDFKAKNGHVKVRRLQEGTNLGEWIHRIRTEYDLYNEGEQVHNLTPERIAELNELGMVWKIRHGRPKKGDERFRLRRKSDSQQPEPPQESENSHEGNMNIG